VEIAQKGQMIFQYREITFVFAQNML